MTKLGGFGFLDSYHCEKTAFITFGAFGAFIFLGIGLVSELQYNPVLFTINDFAITGFILAGIIVLAGYTGVIYYRITNHKKPIFIIQFWSAK